LAQLYFFFGDTFPFSRPFPLFSQVWDRFINVIGFGFKLQQKNTLPTVSFSRQTYMRTHLFYYRYPLRSSKFLLDNSWFNYVSIQKKSCAKKFVHQTIFVWHYIRLFIVDYTYKRIIGLVDLHVFDWIHMFCLAIFI
jgi:hypothetical protein